MKKSSIAVLGLVSLLNGHVALGASPKVACQVVERAAFNALRVSARTKVVQADPSGADISLQIPELKDIKIRVYGFVDPGVAFVSIEAANTESGTFSITSAQDTTGGAPEANMIFGYAPSSAAGANTARVQLTCALKP